MADVQSPALVVYAMDGFAGAGNERDPNNASYNVDSANGLNADYTIWDASRRLTDVNNTLPRHLGSDDVLYADGHVKAMILPEYKGTSVAAAVEAKLPMETAIYADGSNGTAWKDY